MHQAEYISSSEFILWHQNFQMKSAQNKRWYFRASKAYSILQLWW